MTLEFIDDIRETAWLRPPESGHAAAEATLWLGPARFEAYARVLQLPDPVYDRQPEAELADAVFDGAPSDDELVTRVVEVLGGSSDDLFLLLWEGYPYRPALPATARFDLAGLRRYALARGTVEDWARWVHEATEPPGRAFPPAFAWPAARAWCIAFDVDAHFAGVGASEEAITRLLDAEGLSTARASRESTPPLYG
ncbi:hypothetical protein [Aeromicrobium erythreum]|uniref:hypothetical protein n=1 Tax=Aeromicrobium erythreum TaxID=2041 RepID=UPI0008305D95|nr:hypothetical protein [Aeromicrobium erythreum]